MTKQEKLLFANIQPEQSQNTVSFWYTFRNFRLCEFSKCQTSYVIASSLALISDISIIVHIFRCKSDKTVIFFIIINLDRFYSLTVLHLNTESINLKWTFVKVTRLL